MQRMTSKVWYAVAAGLILPGLALTLTGFTELSSTVEGMYRAVMPGRTELLLPMGRSTLYAERKAIVDGKAYQAAEGFSFQCRVTDPAGQPVALARSAASVAYTAGDYAGESAFDLDLAAAGTYVLACEGPAPFVMAVGQGVGTWIILMITGAVPMGLGALIALIVLIKCVRQKRRAAAASAAPGAPAGR